jgi:hypothetical protein
VNSGGQNFSASTSIKVTSYQPDTEAPEVLKIKQLKEKNGINIRFSKPVLGANSKDSYIIEDESQKSILIKNVIYKQDGSESTVDIIFEEKPYTGEYTVEFKGITDNTMEKNAVAGSESFQYKGQSGMVKVLRLIFVKYWWITCIVVLVIVILIIFLVIRKKKGIFVIDGKIRFGNLVEYKQRFETPSENTISLIVTDRKGVAQSVDVNVDQSLFVGRSTINNLSFDDDKLSRQHFVIEIIEGLYFIADLNTTNGTFLNGVPLKSRRRLENNDVITAGREKFVFKQRSQ